MSLIIILEIISWVNGKIFVYATLKVYDNIIIILHTLYYVFGLIVMTSTYDVMYSEQPKNILNDLMFIMNMVGYKL